MASKDTGLGRSQAYTPADDSSRDIGSAPSSVYAAGGLWSPAGLTAFGHSIAVNLATGGLVVSTTDFSMPFYALPMRIRRTWDSQEQHSQTDYLQHHPNTDPRPHLFGNWQLDQEVQATPAWLKSYSDVLVAAGGSSDLFYREMPDFAINWPDCGALEKTVRAYGIPGRTMQAQGWACDQFDSLLRTRQGSFAIVSGRILPETLIDAAVVELWRFNPLTGTATHLSSKYEYSQFIDADGRREVSPSALAIAACDGLGHGIRFGPTTAAPPYRQYELSDDVGRAYRIDLNTMVTFRDGCQPGALAKAYVVSRVTDTASSAGNYVDYAYDSGRLIQASLPAQAGASRRSVQYAYDADGSLVSITDPLGNTLQFAYVEDPLDSDDRLVPRLKVSKIEDGIGNSVTYRYDHPNQTVTASIDGVTGPPRAVSYTYLEDQADTHQRFITSSTVEVGVGPAAPQVIQSSWVYTRDGRFLVTTSKDPLGNDTAFSYNRFNQLESTTNALGHRRNYTYDVHDNPTDAAPNRYDLLKTAETNTDLSGAVFNVASSTQFAMYGPSTSADPLDHVQSTHRAAAVTNPLGNVTRYSYDDVGSNRPPGPTAVVDPLGNTSTRAYDQTGAVVTDTDPAGSVTSWTYNGHGQVLTNTDPNGFTRYWVYDGGTGWLIWATNALGAAAGDPNHSLHYQWSDAAQCVQEQDPVGATTAYAYYPNGRLASVTCGGITPRTTQFSYDGSGLLTVLTDPAGHTTNFMYDDAGRMYQTFRGAAGSPSIVFKLDPAGRVVVMTDRNGNATTFTYDAVGRLLASTEPRWPAAAPRTPGKSIQTIYDDLGQRLKITDSELAAPLLYTYDVAGHLTSATDSFGTVLKYTYDANGALIQLDDGAGVVGLAFGRDSCGRISTVTDSAWLDPSRTFQYHWSAGNLVDNLYGVDYDNSGVRAQFAYNPNRQLASVLYTTPKKPHGYQYSYGRDGLLTNIAGDVTAVYSYDSLKQVITESDSGLSNGYDPVGNRLWRAAVAPPTAQWDVFDAENRLVDDPITGTTYTYDANGNMLVAQVGRSQFQFSYDGANRLRHFDDGKQTVDYLYDYDGHLIQRDVTAGKATVHERLVLSHGAILSVLDETNAAVAVYTRDDQGRLLRRRASDLVRPAPRTDPHSSFYVLDGFGSVVSLVDWDGKDSGVVQYGAWGQIPGARPASIDRFGYRAAMADGISGLILFGARWYTADLGRWISQDPLVSRLGFHNGAFSASHRELVNLYLYALNCPTAYQDMLGMQADWGESPWDSYSPDIVQGYINSFWNGKQEDLSVAVGNMINQRQQPAYYYDYNLALAADYMRARLLTMKYGELIATGLVDGYMDLKWLNLIPPQGPGPVSPYSATERDWMLKGVSDQEASQAWYTPVLTTAERVGLTKFWYPIVQGIYSAYGIP